MVPRMLLLEGDGGSSATSVPWKQVAKERQLGEKQENPNGSRWLSEVILWNSHSVILEHL